MDPHNRSDSFPSEKLDEPYFMRAFSKKETGVPSNRPYTYTELGVSNPGKKLDEMIKIEDLAFVMHSQLIQNLIIGKVLCTLVFFIGLGETLFLPIMPPLLLEFLGFCGSLNLKSGPSKAFIIYLASSIAFRILSSLYWYSILLLTDSCIISDFPWIIKHCEIYLKYIIISLLMTLYELLQIYVTQTLLKKISKMTDSKKDELIYVLTAQKIPRFICWGKLKAWKLVI